jgi:glutathione S-transferase
LLTVHHLGISQSDRIVWLCEELEIPYDFVRYERTAINLTPPAYRALHPSGTSPVITEGDLTLAESGAIIEYIIARHGQGRFSVGPDSPDFADYKYWMHYANGSFMAGGILAFSIGVLNVIPENGTIRDINTRYARGFDMVEKHLATSPFLAGAEFTAADIIMLFPLTTMRLFTPMDLGPFPHIRAYLQRISARPGFQRMVTKISPDPAPPLV